MNNENFNQRRQKILERMPVNSAMLLASSPVSTRNADCEYLFRQDSYFYYVTGFEESASLVLLLKAEDKTQNILFCQSNDPKQARWTGPRVGPENAASQFLFDEAHAIQDAKSTVMEKLKGIESIYFIPGLIPSFDKKLFAWVERFRAQSRGKTVVPHKFCDARQILDELRVIKDTHEIQIIKQACDISVKAHTRAMQSCRAGQYEYELEAEILYEFYRHGSRSPAYTSIVAGGENACILHYIDNNQALKADTLVLIDAGAELHNYSSDITRTFPVNGKFSAIQRDVYNIVLSAQMAAIAQSKKGVPWHALQEAVVAELVQGLVDLKVLKGDVANLIEERAFMPYYMHNCGHWLGLDVHDTSPYHEQGKVRTLENGMVFTIEPGLYFPRDDDNVPAPLKGIGIRIEDDILIENDKASVLTGSLAKTVDEIEALMST